MISVWCFPCSLATVADPSASAALRQPALAVLGYIAYANFLALGRVWMTHGKMPMSAGLWWVYLQNLLIAAGLIWRGQRLRGRRRVFA